MADKNESDEQGPVDCEKNVADSLQVQSPSTNTKRHKPLKTPELRVEKVKDEGNSGSPSEEEGVSPGEASEQEMAATPGRKISSEEDFVQPDDELTKKIISQVEFYFSDANILKDAFLLKHVRRNKQGLVSIKLITSFKKVKSLTKDYRVVAFALRQSEQLFVNEEGTKVKRVEPLPDFDETTPSRTVVAVNLPLENPTIETVAELFTGCGEIALVRVLRPGKTIPGDIKKYSNKHPEIGTTMCAVVEFEIHESAQLACEKTNDEDWRGGMRVVLLSAKGKKNKAEKNNDTKPSRENNKKDEVENNDAQGDIAAAEKESSPTPFENASAAVPNEQKNPDIKEPVGKKNRNRNRQKKNKAHNKLLPDGDANTSGSDVDLSTSPSSRDPQWRSSLSPGKIVDRNKLSPVSTPGSSPRGSPRGSPTSRRKSLGTKSPLASDGGYGKSPCQSPKPSPMSSPETHRRGKDSNDNSPSGSPWVQRRLKAAQEISPLAQSPRGSPLPSRKGVDNLVRQPKGPDGTKGFYGGVGRGKPRSDTAP